MFSSCQLYLNHAKISIRDEQYNYLFQDNNANTSEKDQAYHRIWFRPFLYLYVTKDTNDIYRVIKRQLLFDHSIYIVWSHNICRVILCPRTLFTFISKTYRTDAGTYKIRYVCPSSIPDELLYYHSSFVIWYFPGLNSIDW